MKEIVKKYHSRDEIVEPILTSIVIIRTNDLYNMIERINYRNIYNNNPNIEILIVNDGSNEVDSQIIESMCQKNGFSYLELETHHDVFNASRARNMGAIYAKSKFIMHEDIDLIGYSEFYNDLIRQISIQNLNEDHSQIITVPVAYLNKEASTQFLEMDDLIRKPYFINSYLKGERENFEFFMPASSVILINRYYYLTIGGYNERFVNWGLEDLEFIYRCIKSINKFVLPERDKALFTSPEFSKQLSYKGWRTMFRLHGDLMFNNGIILFHIHHEKDIKWRNKKSHGSNVKLFNECTQRFDKEGHYLPPLPSKLDDKSLIFGKGCFAYNRRLIPFFGEMVVKGYENFDESKNGNINIVKFIKENSINRVIFTNPYANEQRLSIYRVVKEAKIPYYVVERGALRDSIFIDPNGFSCESSSYSEDLWDKSISDSERNLTIDYINNEKITDSSLEHQPNRIGKGELNYKLGLASTQKVLFVPLQSRSDTTINYFAGDIVSYDNFLQLVRDVTATLDSSWTVLVKKHPLSKIDEDIPNAIFVDNINVKDLLDRSNAILLINSGVGVLGSLWGKPVLHCGQAFYRSNKLNRKVTTCKEVLDALDSNFKPSREHVIRFISYLINQFYCFGDMTTFTKDYTNDARLTITTDIKYYKVNVNKNTIFESIDQDQIPVTAPIYDIFRDSMRETVSLKNTSKNSSKKEERLIKSTSIAKSNLQSKTKPKLSIHKLQKKTKKFIKQPKQSLIDIINKRL